MFLLDAEAWVTQAIVPLKLAGLVFGGSKPTTGNPATRAPARPFADGAPGGLPSWYRVPQARKFTVHDLGPIEGEAPDPSRLDRSQYAGTVKAIRRAFLASTKQLGGSLAAASPMPLARLGVRIPSPAPGP